MLKNRLQIMGSAPLTRFRARRRFPGAGKRCRRAALLSLLVVMTTFLPLGAVATAASAALSEAALVDAVQSHQTKDGSAVGDVVGNAAGGIRALGWWADQDKQEAGYTYTDYTAPKERHFVIWDVGADGTVTPLSEEAWIVELGRLPFSYFINQRNLDDGAKQYVDRRLIGNPRALAFMATADGNLAQIFAQKHLALRRMTIQWISDPSGKATGGRLYYGYLVAIDLACRGPQGETVNQSVQFMEPHGDGGFERLDRPEPNAVSTPAVNCLP